MRIPGRLDAIGMTERHRLPPPIGLLTRKVVVHHRRQQRQSAPHAARLFAREGAAVCLARPQRTTPSRQGRPRRSAPDGGVADAVALDLVRPGEHPRRVLTASTNCTDDSTAPSNNGAAIQQPGPLDTTSDEYVDRQFAVNFRAHWTAMTAEAATDAARRPAGRSSTPRASAAAARTPTSPLRRHEARAHKPSPRPPR